MTSSALESDTSYTLTEYKMSAENKINIMMDLSTFRLLMTFMVLLAEQTPIMYIMLGPYVLYGFQTIYIMVKIHNGLKVHYHGHFILLFIEAIAINTMIIIDCMNGGDFYWFFVLNITSVPAGIIWIFILCKKCGCC